MMLTAHLCLQHDAREAARRAGPSATADTCWVKWIRERVARSDVTAAEKSEDWQTVTEYYAAVFESFTNMNVAFKVILLLAFRWPIYPFMSCSLLDKSCMEL